MGEKDGAAENAIVLAADKPESSPCSPCSTSAKGLGRRAAARGCGLGLVLGSARWPKATTRAKGASPAGERWQKAHAATWSSRRWRRVSRAASSF